MPRPSDREQLNRRALELTTLYEISKLLGSSLDLEQNLTAMLRILSSFMGMRKGAILLYDPMSGELTVRLSLGMSPEEVARGKYQKGDGILGKVMQVEDDTSVVSDILVGSPQSEWKTAHPKHDCPIAE